MHACHLMVLRVLLLLLLLPQCTNESAAYVARPSRTKQLKNPKYGKLSGPMLPPDEEEEEAEAAMAQARMLQKTKKDAYVDFLFIF